MIDLGTAKSICSSSKIYYKIYSNPESILAGCYYIDVERLDNLEFDSIGIKEACR